MDYQDLLPSNVLHWNYRGFTEFPIERIRGEESSITDIYFKENLITRVPPDIGKLLYLESLYLSGNDITELPREISELRCLKCLDVSGNRLRRIPDEIGNMMGLKFLILDENELRELPLRIVELRALRYLSVCDNKLQWLPQRPVYNYHHCEFRFWRNTSLKTIPYSLWYHMLREQQTRCLNIGCLTVPKYQHKHARCRLRLHLDSREVEYTVDCPPQHNNILESGIASPPSLQEISKRIFYQVISNTAKNLSTCTFSIYSEDTNNNENNNNITSLEGNFGQFNINKNVTLDMNGNSDVNSKSCKKKCYHVPSDLLEEYFNFLPYFMKQELCNGPISRCENSNCRKPLFDYVVYEFCLGKIILIDNTEEVILSAAFCSKLCADTWKRGKSNLFKWTLQDEN